MTRPAPTVTVGSRSLPVSRDGYGHLIVGGYDVAQYGEDVQRDAMNAAKEARI